MVECWYNDIKSKMEISEKKFYQRNYKKFYQGN